MVEMNFDSVDSVENYFGLILVGLIDDSAAIVQDAR